jgi:hypothetical protein
MRDDETMSSRMERGGKRHCDGNAVGRRRIVIANEKKKRFQ